MADDPREAGPAGPAVDEDEDRAPSTPFDSPYFLPVMLWGFALWFGYDGWFNAEMEYIKFNRYGFGLFLGFALYYTVDTFNRTPWALVALWVGFGLWFAYMAFLGEGWYTEGEAALMFNQGMVALSVLMILYALWKARSTESAG